MKECESFAELLQCINAGDTNLSLEDVGLTQQEIEELASVLKNNTSLQALDLAGNNIGDDGAKLIADAIEKSTSLKDIYLKYNRIRELGAKALDKAILANKNILYSSYPQSRQIEKELENRQAFIKKLIIEWNDTIHRNIFTTQQITEFYNNKDAINIVSINSSICDVRCAIDFDAFEKEINARMCKDVYILIKNALMQNLPKELVHYTACFWMQLPCYLKPIVLNTPAISAIPITQEQPSIEQ